MRALAGACERFADALTTVAGQPLDPWTPTFKTGTLLLRIREKPKAAKLTKQQHQQPQPGQVPQPSASASTAPADPAADPAELYKPIEPHVDEEFLALDKQDAYSKPFLINLEALDPRAQPQRDLNGMPIAQHSLQAYASSGRGGPGSTSLAVA